MCSGSVSAPAEIQPIKHIRGICVLAGSVPAGVIVNPQNALKGTLRTVIPEGGRVQELTSVGWKCVGAAMILTGLTMLGTGQRELLTARSGGTFQCF